MFPALVIVKFPNLKNRHIAYILVQIACFAWLIVSSIGAPLNAGSALTPLTAFFWSLFGHNRGGNNDFILGSAFALMVDAGVIAGLISMAAGEFRTVRNGIKRAAAKISHESIDNDLTPPISS